MSAQEMAGQKELARHYPNRRIRNGQINCICGWKTETTGQANQQKSFRRHQIRKVLAAANEADAKSDSAGLVARLSASGGRNIDLRKRATDAEAAANGVRELHRPVWHTWTELDGTPGAGLICDHCTPTGFTSMITHHPCPTINVLEASKA